MHSFSREIKIGLGLLGYFVNLQFKLNQRRKRLWVFQSICHQRRNHQRIQINFLSSSYENLCTWQFIRASYQFLRSVSALPNLKLLLQSKKKIVQKHTCVFLLLIIYSTSNGFLIKLGTSSRSVFLHIILMTFYSEQSRHPENE